MLFYRRFSHTVGLSILFRSGPFPPRRVRRLSENSIAAGLAAPRYIEPFTNGFRIAFSLSYSTKKPSCPNGESISRSRLFGMCRYRNTCSDTGNSMSDEMPTIIAGHRIVESALSTPPRERPTLCESKACVSR